MNISHFVKNFTNLALGYRPFSQNYPIRYSFRLFGKKTP